MNLITESTLVSLYTFGLYSLRRFFITSPNLFVLGFLKHFLGYYIGIHDLYCKNKIPGSVAYERLSTLILESILEGVAFMTIGKLLKYSKFDTLTSVILIPVIIHILFEKTGINTIFLNNKCRVISNGNQ